MPSADQLEADIYELKTRLVDALEELNAKEQDLIMAAELGQQLVQQNAQLQAQLDALSAASSSGSATDLLDDVAGLRQKLRDTEKSAERQIQALTRSNQTLTHDLASAEKAVRKTESEAARRTKILESDLDTLREELDAFVSKSAALDASASAQAAAALRKDRSEEDALADKAALLEMEAAVKALSAWKKEAEKTVKQTSQAMQDSVSRTQELELSLSSVRQEFERRGNLIVELQEQLEDSRSQLLDMNDGINPATVPPSSKLKKKSSQVWEWMPWPESFRSKPAEPKTLASLVEEVEETKKTREEAYQKLKKDMDGMMGKFAGSVKSSVSSGWSAVSSVSSSVSTSVSSSLSNITVPQQLLGSPGEKGTTAKSPTTSAKSSARNGPPKRKPTPVAYSHILSEYY